VSAVVTRRHREQLQPLWSARPSGRRQPLAAGSKSRSRVGFHDWGALDADYHEFVASQPTIGDLALIGAADE
jgi:hypothetical protein